MNSFPEEDELENLIANKGSHYSVLSRDLFEQCKAMERGWKNKEYTKIECESSDSSDGPKPPFLPPK